MTTTINENETAEKNPSPEAVKGIPVPAEHEDMGKKQPAGGEYMTTIDLKLYDSMVAVVNVAVSIATATDVNRFMNLIYSLRTAVENYKAHSERVRNKRT